MTDPSWSVCVSCGCIIRRPEKLLPCPACGGSPFGVRPLDPRAEGLADDEWHARHKAGMAAAADKTASHRLAGASLESVRRANRERWPCKIKGCTRTAYKGDLCRGHYDLVPLDMVMRHTTDVIHAQLAAARKGHRKQLAYVRAVLREQAGART